MHHEECIRALHSAARKTRHRPRTRGPARRGEQARRAGTRLLRREARRVRVGHLVEAVRDPECRPEADLGRLVAAEGEVGAGVG